MTTAHTSRRRAGWIPIVAGLGASALLLTGCSAAGSSTASPKEFTYLSFTENTAIAETLTSLSTGACAAENTALPLKVTNQPQASYDQQLQLLAGQKALPSLFAAGNTPQVAKDLASSGQLVDIGAALTDLGVADAILPAAGTAINSLYGSDIGIPTELNIEGIWYNKTILTDNGITPPTTWDELVDDAATVKAAGVTPFAAAGKDGWPLTRLVGSYIYRTVGPDALQAVADGDAQLTDPEYVAAADAVAELGAEGYFGEGVGSIDYATAENAFLSGSAAFFYMGSWALSDFNDPEKAVIGSENIGFIPFPDVAGGAGSSDQVGANVGVPLAMSQTSYDDKSAAWLKCIAENFGQESLSAQGVLTGLTVNGEVEVPELTAQVQDTIAATDTSVLWFEALLNAQATTTSQTNAGQLVTGAISGADFMKLVQADLG